MFSIFFIGYEFDEASGEDEMKITSNGIAHFKKGLDVAGGVRLTYRIDYSRYEQIYQDEQRLEEVKSNVESIILQNIDDRISALGVSDYSSYIQSIGEEDYVVVEIGGVQDIDAAKDIIGKTVELEFKVPFEDEDRDDETKDSRQLLSEEFLTQLVNEESSFEEIYQENQDNGVRLNTHQGDDIDEFPSYIQENYDELVEGGQGHILPSLVEDEEEESWYILGFEGQQEGNYSFLALEVDYYPQWHAARDPESGQILNAAFFNYASVDSSETGRPVVLVRFNSEGGQIFCNLTNQHVGEQMAIFVGGQLRTAPVIRESICGGTAQIDGDFDSQGARELADSLNEGAMPAPLLLSQEEMVSPTLGENALNAALIAAGVGFFLIFIFMIFFYGWKMGLVSLITLLFFLTILFGLVKVLGYALSLSGIAAVILSIGIAVDANVLIFERVREEMKSGKGKILSIHDGFARSISAIRDGNLTTGLIGLLLFMIGTNVFRGFGTMMIVNIALILAVVVPLTKLLLLLIYDYTEEDSTEEATSVVQA
ncbi:protein translocase subunit SecD [Candidatus Absconditicoccus praedator]|uniref:protein translocase subunit SecD n=1 Tax=Candidatus Absconditicoccus praedator TaxID=2735562 RepID=UPI001E3B067E|nr:protein translocase subunit SecD [Candidatus Absconditicoccus praedator]UFX83273.1 protein translocase subunit SecD [Candidatus Absconditicoccus praedator]